MSSRRPSRATRRLVIESLEERHLLSVASLPLPGQFLDLGRVDFSQVTLADSSPAGQWLRLSAHNTATLTAIRGPSPANPSGLGVTVYTVSGNQLVELARGNGRVDTSVIAGSTYFVWLAQAQSGEQLFLANLVRVTGTTVTVFGTPGDDTFDFDGTNRLTVNGVSYQFSTSWQSLSMSTGPGQDSATIVTGLSSENIVYTPGRLLVSTPSRSIEVSGIENLTVSASPSAVAEVNDSPADDNAVLYPQRVSITGGGFSATIIGPQTIHVYARNGGQDAITFYDSPQADQASYNNSVALLQGVGFYNRAKFFESVTFVATPGAEDTALLMGTKGADRLSGRLGDVTLMAGGTNVRAVNFWTTIIRSAGGTDTAEIDDSPQDDWVFSFPGDVSLFNMDLTVRVYGFAYTHVYSRCGGFDKAYFYDSVGDDLFIGRQDFSSFTTGPYFSRVKFFDAVYAYSRSGGYDTARLYDSSANDELTIRPLYVRLEGPGFSNRVETFANIVAYSTNGGSDRVLAYESDGKDQVTVASSATQFLLADTQTLVTARGFKQETYFLDRTDEVKGTAPRMTVNRGEPSTVIYAIDYFDPSSPTLGFQQAIDALPNEGGVVVLPAGVFELRQGLVLRSNVTLRGSDTGTTLKRAPLVNVVKRGGRWISSHQRRRRAWR